jgi:hypothetical protein
MDLVASEDGARDGSLAVVAEALRPYAEAKGSLRRRWGRRQVIGPP